jgi:hypothetical protein
LYVADVDHRQVGMVERLFEKLSGIAAGLAAAEKTAAQAVDCCLRCQIAPGMPAHAVGDRQQGRSTAL